MGPTRLLLRPSTAGEGCRAWRLSCLGPTPKRITRQLRGRHEGPEEVAPGPGLVRRRALEGFKTFNFQWGRRVLGQGRWSCDQRGWDRGDADLLSPRSHACNEAATGFDRPPLDPTYSPPRGMRLPAYIDDFLPVHNLAAWKTWDSISGSARTGVREGGGGG
jgi:hypothetical protein